MGQRYKARGQATDDDPRVLAYPVYQKNEPGPAPEIKFSTKTFLLRLKINLKIVAFQTDDQKDFKQISSSFRI
jgi:hypothetical protein